MNLNVQATSVVLLGAGGAHADAGFVEIVSYG